MSEARTWKPVGEYRWVCAPWTVTRYEVAGGPMFALWKGEDQKATGYSRDRGSLMALAKNLDEAEAKNVQRTG